MAIMIPAPQRLAVAKLVRPSTRTDEARLIALFNAAGRAVRTDIERVSIERFLPSDAAAAMFGIRNTVAALNRAITGWLESNVAKYYDRSARRARTALEILGLRERKKPVFDHRRKLIDDTAKVLLRASGSIVDTARRIISLTALAAQELAAVRASVQEFSFSEIEAQVVRAARAAVRTEGTVGDVYSKVRKLLVGFVEEGQYIDINGRHYKIRPYAELVANTVLAEAQTAATLDLCNQFDNDLVKWSDHQTKCEECEEYEGLIFSISGRHPEYPLLEASPPIHPNCEHSLLPTTDIALALEKKHGIYQRTGELIGG